MISEVLYKLEFQDFVVLRWIGKKERKNWGKGGRQNRRERGRDKPQGERHMQHVLEGAVGLGWAWKEIAKRQRDGGLAGWDICE